MSEISDELREYCKDLYKGGPNYMTLMAIADRIDAEHQKAEDEWKAKDGRSWLSGYGECHTELMEGNEAMGPVLGESVMGLLGGAE